MRWKTGFLTAIKFLGYLFILRSLIFLPADICAAYRAKGISVTLLTKGTVLLDRGLTSSV